MCSQHSCRAGRLSPLQQAQLVALACLGSAAKGLHFTRCYPEEVARAGGSREDFIRQVEATGREYHGRYAHPFARPWTNQKRHHWFAGHAP